MATAPVPVNASMVPAVAKLTVPPLATVTATALGRAAGLAHVNWPPVTLRLVLASVPFTTRVAPLTSVAPVYVLLPDNVPVPVPVRVSDPLPLKVPP